MDIIKKIKEKSEFSEIPDEDVERALELYKNKDYSDLEKVKVIRDLFRKIYSGFGGKKIFNWNDRTADEILKKHLSTRERYPFYDEIYSRIFKNLPKEVTVIDFGCGTNGFSYNYIKNQKLKFEYLGFEIVGQLCKLTNDFFESQKIKSKVYHKSLFELDSIKQIVSKSKKPRVMFMFKVLDSLEKIERDYTKRFLLEMVPLSEKFVLSFATESWIRRKKFYVQRTWIIDFIRENFEFIDDFNLGGERYLVFRNK